MCNVLDEYVSGRRVVVQFAREPQPGRKIKNPTNRKEIGYLGFYFVMLNLLRKMKVDAPEVYTELHEVIREWITEARYVVRKQ